VFTATNGAGLTATIEAWASVGPGLEVRFLVDGREDPFVTITVPEEVDSQLVVLGLVVEEKAANVEIEEVFVMMYWVEGEEVKHELMFLTQKADNYWEGHIWPKKDVLYTLECNVGVRWTGDGYQYKSYCVAVRRLLLTSEAPPGPEEGARYGPYVFAAGTALVLVGVVLEVRGRRE